MKKFKLIIVDISVNIINLQDVQKKITSNNSEVSADNSTGKVYPRQYGLCSWQ